MNGLMLMSGVNRFFQKYHMPYTSRWRFSRFGMWEKIEEMLLDDIPVIMSVGPNFPFFWGKERASFYTRTPTGAYLPASGARAHYFTVTGLDENWLRISSWAGFHAKNPA